MIKQFKVYRVRPGSWRICGLFLALLFIYPRAGIIFAGATYLTWLSFQSDTLLLVPFSLWIVFCFATAISAIRYFDFDLEEYLSEIRQLIENG